MGLREIFFIAIRKGDALARCAGRVGEREGVAVEIPAAGGDSGAGGGEAAGAGGGAGEGDAILR